MVLVMLQKLCVEKHLAVLGLNQISAPLHLLQFRKNNFFKRLHWFVVMSMLVCMQMHKLPTSVLCCFITHSLFEWHQTQSCWG